MRNTIRRAVIMAGLTVNLIMGSAGVGAAQTQDENRDVWSPFITPMVLNTLIERRPDVQVIDIRKEKYIGDGTIPGAVWMPFSDWRGPSERPGQPPTEAELEAFLGDNGLQLDQPIVIHNHSDHTIQSGRAAIVYWILKSAGAEEIAILNGGFKAWDAEALPLTPEHTRPQPGIVDVTYRYDWWAGPMEIFGVTTRQSNGAILDARLDGQVRRAAETGRPLTSMPMAQYIPASFFSNYLSVERLSERSQDAFRADLRDRGIDFDTGMLISICQTGELSALSWFYASEIVGLSNVRYYPDALQGWQSDGGRMYGMKTSL
ncbi:sulfurtransferase [Yoonia sp. 2307UL14-13]|uniref:sulfurtransferase n=1 Tax=Yoonia sp. 2307UL14-13 TaxID=3126506 RepID=UPI0030B55D74